MEGALIAGEALADHLGVLVDEDGHYFEPFTAWTIFERVGEIFAEMMADPICQNLLPNSTLVPSRRTTSGTLT